MNAKKVRRAINLGEPGNPPGESEPTPCAIELEMALLQLSGAQRGQLKPLLVMATQTFTKHIDHLHRENLRLTRTVAALTEMVRHHDLSYKCGNCNGFTVEYLLENGCLSPEHLEAGTECEMLCGRRQVHGVEKKEWEEDAADTGNQAATEPPSNS